MPRYSGAYPTYTEEDIARIVRESTEYWKGGLSANRPPFETCLAGKELTLRFDERGPIHYRFEDDHKLTWTDEEQPEPKEEYYECLRADDEVLFFLHILRGTRPQRARLIIWSTDTNRVTMFACKIGNQFSPREVDREILFGYADRGTPPTGEPHSLTDDLIGKSIIWTYGPNFTIQHIYASRWYSAFVDYNSPIGGAMLDSPCNYVKINDHVYIYSWIEIEGAGVQGFALMNLWTMHDVGCFFGINGSGHFECYTFGAVGEYAGQLANLTFPHEFGKEYPWPPMPPKEGA